MEEKKEISVKQGLHKSSLYRWFGVIRTNIKNRLDINLRFSSPYSLPLHGVSNLRTNFLRAVLQITVNFFERKIFLQLSKVFSSTIKDSSSLHSTTPSVAFKQKSSQVNIHLKKLFISRGVNKKLYPVQQQHHYHTSSKQAGICKKFKDDITKKIEEYHQKDDYEKYKFWAFTIISIPSGIAGIYKIIQYNIEMKDKIYEYINNLDVDQSYIRISINNLNLPDILIERKELEVDLRRKVNKQQAGQQLAVAKVVISGEGGIGKTTLAKSYGEKHHTKKADTVDTVFIFQANNPQQLEQEYQKFVRQIMNVELLEEYVTDTLILKVNAVLRKRPNWLLIFDNVTNSQDIQRYLPNDSKQSGTVLILTQGKKLLSDFDADATVNVDAMKPDESLALLNGYLEPIYPGANLKYLAEKLNYIPLALRSSASFLKNKKIDIETYLTSIQINANSEKIENSTINERVIKHIFEQLPVEAKEMMSMFVFFASTDIPSIPEFFDALINTLTKTAQPRSHKHGLKRETMLEELKDYGFVDENSKGKSFLVPTVIQQVIQESIQGVHRENILIKAKKVLMSFYKLDNTNIENISKNAAFNPHVSAIMRHIDVVNSQELRVSFAHYFMVSGNYYMQQTQENIPLAHQQLEEAKKFCEQDLDELDKKTPEQICISLAAIDKRLPAIYAATLHYLGKIVFFYEKSYSVTALLQLKKAVALQEIIEKNLDRYIDDVNQAKFGGTSIYKRVLANALYEQSKSAPKKSELALLDAAENIYKDLIEKYPADQTNKSICHNQLAKIYLERGLYVEAIKYLENNEKTGALDMALDAKSPRYKAAAEYLNTLGKIYLASKKLGEAEDAFKRAKNMCIGHDIIQSFELADAHENLSDIYSIREDYQQAYREINACIKIREKIYASNHPLLNQAYIKQKEYETHTEVLGVESSFLRR